MSEPDHSGFGLERLELRLQVLERELARTEAVVEAYELLLRAAWDLIDDLRRRTLG